MGFCLLNNVADRRGQARRAAGERVLIVDWDVHHGNGTQALFWDEPDVLYVSVHQSPCYPGTGAASEIGGSSARGSTLNVPVPPGATGDVVRTAFDRWSPRRSSASRRPGSSSRRASTHTAPIRSPSSRSPPATSPTLAAVVAGYAPRPGRLVVFLEGGYDLGAIRSSVSATLGALTGADDLRRNTRRREARESSRSTPPNTCGACHSSGEILNLEVGDDRR